MSINQGVLCILVERYNWKAYDGVFLVVDRGKVKVKGTRTRRSGYFEMLSPTSRGDSHRGFMCIVVREVLTQ